MKNPHRYVHDAIDNQWVNIRTIWSHETSPTFGVERLFRLFLALTAYFFPGIYIRYYFGKDGLLSRKLALDGFVTLKLILPLVILKLHWQKYLAAQFLVSYLGIETLLYILSLLFLSDIYKPPISNKRSYLMLVMNYVEICLDFAVVYGGQNLISNASNSIDIIYFSFVTAFTVGFGDMVPKNRDGRELVILQSLVSMIFITLAFTKVVSGFVGNRSDDEAPSENDSNKSPKPKS